VHPRVVVRGGGAPAPLIVPVDLPVLDRGAGRFSAGAEREGDLVLPHGGLPVALVLGTGCREPVVSEAGLREPVRAGPRPAAAQLPQLDGAACGAAPGGVRDDQLAAPVRHHAVGQALPGDAGRIGLLVRTALLLRVVRLIDDTG